MTRIANIIAVIGLTALLAVTGLTLVEIVLRSAPGLWLRDQWPGLEGALTAMGLEGISDLYGPLGIVAVAACFPAMAANRSAITVRFVTDMLPWRARETMGLMGDAVLLGMAGLMAWWLTGYARDLWTSGETTWILEIPRWPAFAIASLCLWVTALIQAMVTAEQAGRALGRAEPPPRLDLEAGAE